MTVHRTAIHPSSARRALTLALGISLTAHLLAVALLPRSASRLPPAVRQQAPLHARLPTLAPQTPVRAPAAPIATIAATEQGPDRRRNPAQVVTVDAPQPRQAVVVPAAPPPTVDLQAALAAARSIGKTGAAPRELGAPPRPPLTVETVIARATRPDLLVEERDAAGNWIHRVGGRRCVVALNHVPHYMQGMAIPVQCDVSKS